jgi:hypothetical protein
LKSQLKDECDKYFVRGWRAALDRAGVDDASELYDLGPRCRPFRPVSPEVHDDEGAAEGPMDHEEEGAAEGLNDHEAGDGQDPDTEVLVEDGSDGEDIVV